MDDADFDRPFEIEVEVKDAVSGRAKEVEAPFLGPHRARRTGDRREGTHDVRRDRGRDDGGEPRALGDEAGAPTAERIDARSPSWNGGVER
jgi:hypothetical protein